ncbi:M4 family metallopeptidase [Streptomyces sp. NPDC050504]|uniref:M4 family metallopeptidase n=1 Tax=Streptomyces sp. NPDC050504 TaxID=3365618 RepID=UPI0037A187D8
MSKIRKTGTKSRPRTAAGPARISGVAALVGAASLLAGTVQATAAPLPHGPAAKALPGEVVPGEGTATPALVDGIAERTRATGNAADAARAHLAGKKDRYAIADPGRDLAAPKTLTDGGDETVRFQQRHRGLPVLGGQYLVRMAKKDGARVVTGTSGRYFTGLDVSPKASVAERTAVERAVAATRADLTEKLTAKGARPQRQLSGASHGLIVLPQGKGVLTYHVTVAGTDPTTGAPVKEEVYVDAAAGFPVLRYSGIQTIRHPGTQGSGTKLDGKKVPLEVFQRGGAYQLRDYKRLAGSSKQTLTTWDATGVEAEAASGTWPAGIKEVASPKKAFGKAATASGAVDAHWAAGQVYDYYKKKHGRDSLDGRGMAINSLVGVVENGQPFVNAFWDGQKMVYGTGDAEFKPLSADLDVVGHEMTHGVVEHTAGLVYVGQSGALNEAVADYFGNAIDVEVAGNAKSPNASLIGEDLCRTQGPRACAMRDLNDGRTTAKDFLGVTYGTDNGGVHLNSTIFSGALWDVREDLGGKLADRIVYKALGEYLTPLDGFTQARAAVVAAAKDLGVKGARLRAVNRAFDAHGIVPGWEKAIGVDSDRLFGDVNIAGTEPGAGGGWWASSKSDDEGGEPYSLYVGRTDGRGTPKIVSPNDGRYHVHPDTDGTSVAWAAYGANGVDLLWRPLAGGPVRKLWSSPRAIGNVHVAGRTVVFQETGQSGLPRVGWITVGDRAPRYADGGDSRVATALPTISGTKVAYARTLDGANGEQHLTTEIRDLKTGTKTTLAPRGARSGLSSPTLNGRYLYWLVDDIEDDWRQGLRRAKLDGTGVTDLVPEQSENAYFQAVDASDQALNLTHWKPRSWGPVWVPLANEHLTKVLQADLNGKNVQRVSCNRGDQIGAAADTGRRVVWLDGTTGHTDLVTRNRPAGRCA